MYIYLTVYKQMTDVKLNGFSDPKQYVRTLNCVQTND